jgi:hypothetical protein
MYNEEPYTARYSVFRVDKAPGYQLYVDGYNGDISTLG